MFWLLKFLTRRRGVQLFSDLHGLFLLMYAYDRIFISDRVSGMQEQWNILGNYYSAWKLNVNLSKTKLIVFRKGGIVEQCEKWYYRNELHQNISTLDLGLTMTPSLTLTSATCHIWRSMRKDHQ